MSAATVEPVAPAAANSAATGAADQALSAAATAAPAASSAASNAEPQALPPPVAPTALAVMSAAVVDPVAANASASAPASVADCEPAAAGLAAVESAPAVAQPASAAVPQTPAAPTAAVSTGAPTDASPATLQLNTAAPPAPATQQQPSGALDVTAAQSNVDVSAAPASSLTPAAQASAASDASTVPVVPVAGTAAPLLPAAAAVPVAAGPAAADPRAASPAEAAIGISAAPTPADASKPAVQIPSIAVPVPVKSPPIGLLTSPASSGSARPPSPALAMPSTPIPAAFEAPGTHAPVYGELALTVVAVGDPVWISHPTEAYLPAIVHEVTEKAVTVRILDAAFATFGIGGGGFGGAAAPGTPLVTLPIHDAAADGTKSARTRGPRTRLFPRTTADAGSSEPPAAGAVGIENMDDLPFLHEAAILDNVRMRFASDCIYTATGPILIAVNPYRWLDIYGDAVMARYKQASWLKPGGAAVPPHCYQIADNALSHVRDANGRGSASIIICGDSGSGKTETTKLMLKYLSRVASKTADDEMANRIMLSNPIMEAFGNAKTVSGGPHARRLAARGAYSVASNVPCSMPVCFLCAAAQS